MNLESDKARLPNTLNTSLYLLAFPWMEWVECSRFPLVHGLWFVAFSLVQMYCPLLIQDRDKKRSKWQSLLYIYTCPSFQANGLSSGQNYIAKWSISIDGNPDCAHFSRCNIFFAVSFSFKYSTQNSCSGSKSSWKQSKHRLIILYMMIFYFSLVNPGLISVIWENNALPNKRNWSVFDLKIRAQTWSFVNLLANGRVNISPFCST